MLLEGILNFYFSLPKPCDLQGGIAVVYPFENEETKRVMQYRRKEKEYYIKLYIEKLHQLTLH